MMKLKIIIVDDHEIFRKGISRLLNQTSWATVCADAGDLTLGLNLVADFQPDILLLDLYLGNDLSVGLIPKIKLASPRTKIVVLTISEDVEDIRKTAEYAVDGYLLKSTPFLEFENHLKNVVNGQICISDSLASLLFKDLVDVGKKKPLTPREQDVLALLGEGLSNKEIADRLHISLYTVKNHVGSIIKKLNISNRYQVLAGKKF